MGTVSLPRSSPESLGIPSSAVLDFVDQADETLDELHSLMLLRRGQVAAAGWWRPCAPERPHMLFSLTKSFTATAAGLAVAEGRFGLDDAVTGFFPDELPAEVSPNLAALRVRHLLTMSTGQAADPTSAMDTRVDGDWARGFLAAPVENPPGAPFVYNSGASYMLSAIVQRTTGQRLQEYLQPRLFAPLGIDARIWETCPRGVNIGGWGLSLRTEDIARFGQLYLQDGVWGGARILPEGWVAAASAAQVPADASSESDWSQGYGYQFWRCRHGAYRGDGAFGQFCLVLPEQEAVLAITAGLSEMQPVLSLVWATLLPALGAAPLPEDAPAHARLEERLAGLAHLPPAGAAGSPAAAEISGRAYTLAENSLGLAAITFDFSGGGASVALAGADEEHRLACGAGVWREGTTALFGHGPQRVAASGVWAAPDAYVITLRFYETPFTFTLTCRFAGERLSARVVANLSIGPKMDVALEGQRPAPAARSAH